MSTETTPASYNRDWHAGVLAANTFAESHTTLQLRNELARARDAAQRFTNQPADGTRDGYVTQLASLVEEAS